MSRLTPAVLALLLAACGAPASQADTNAPAPSVPPADSDTAAKSANAAPPAATGTDNSNRGVVSVLNDVMTVVGQVDGVPVTRVIWNGRCRTSFSTAKGQIVIDWSRVADFQSRIENGRVVLPIDDGAGAHSFSVPEGSRPEPAGHASARVEGGFGTLVDRCSKS